MNSNELFLKSVAKLNEKANKKLAEALAENKLDISPEQLQVLSVLWELESCTQQEIANRVGRERATITRIIDTMEKKKLVKRKASKSDKRSNQITLTKQSEAMQEKALAIKAATSSNIFADIDGYELNMTQMLLDRILENL